MPRIQINALKRRLAPFLFVNRARMSYNKHSIACMRNYSNINSKSLRATKKLQLTNANGQDSMSDLDVAYVCSTNANDYQQQHQDVQECFTLDISSWDKHEFVDVHGSHSETIGCSLSSGCVKEIDLYLAESESCSNSETQSNEGLFSTFDDDECSEDCTLNLL